MMETRELTISSNLPIGINLKVSYTGSGVYIDSFAEMSLLQQSLAVGDVVTSINDTDTSNWTLDKISDSIANLPRPFTIRFADIFDERALRMESVLEDPRKWRWVLQFVSTGPNQQRNRSRYGLMELHQKLHLLEKQLQLRPQSSLLARLLGTLNDDLIFREILGNYRKGRHPLSIAFSPQALLQSLQAAIEPDVRQLYSQFLLSPAARQMQAHFFFDNSPLRGDVTCQRLLQCPVCSLIFYLYCCKINRQAELLWYLQVKSTLRDATLDSSSLHQSIKSLRSLMRQQRSLTWEDLTTPGTCTTMTMGLQSSESGVKALEAVGEEMEEAGDEILQAVVTVAMASIEDYLAVEIFPMFVESLEFQKVSGMVAVTHEVELPGSEGPLLSGSLQQVLKEISLPNSVGKHVARVTKPNRTTTQADGSAADATTHVTRATLPTHSEEFDVSQRIFTDDDTPTQPWQPEVANGPPRAHTSHSTTSALVVFQEDCRGDVVICDSLVAMSGKWCRRLHTGDDTELFSGAHLASLRGFLVPQRPALSSPTDIRTKQYSFVAPTPDNHMIYGCSLVTHSFQVQPTKATVPPLLWATPCPTVATQETRIATTSNDKPWSIVSSSNLSLVLRNAPVLLHKVGNTIADTLGGTISSLRAPPTGFEAGNPSSPSTQGQELQDFRNRKHATEDSDEEVGSTEQRLLGNSDNEMEALTKGPKEEPEAEARSRHITRHISNSALLQEETQSRTVRTLGAAVLTIRPVVRSLRRALQPLGDALRSQHELADWASIDIQQLAKNVSSDFDVPSSDASFHPVPCQPSATTEENVNLPLAGPSDDIDFRVVLETLSPHNIASIFLGILLEQKIVLVSSRSRSAALTVGEFFRIAISPLRWCHIYCPSLSHQMAEEMTECPLPYIIGISKSRWRAIQANKPDGFSSSSSSKEIFLVDLDNSQCYLPANLGPVLQPMGKSLVRSLEETLRPGYWQTDEAAETPNSCPETSQIEKATQVLEICQAFVKQLLSPISACTLSLSEAQESFVFVDEALYINQVTLDCGNEKDRSATQSASSQIKPFLELFLRTQAFSECATH